MTDLIPTHSLASLNARNGYCWFATDSMRFFNSRVSEYAYLTADKAVAYFVSSEKMRGFRRLYSVRAMDMTTGQVDTMGDFQGYTTRAAAHRVAKAKAEQTI